MAVLVAAAFTVRALEAGAYREALLAGTFAGVALAVKPANALFLAAPLVAFVLARRWRQALLFGIALAPAALALTIWKAKGLGTVPLFAQSSVSVAAGLGDPVLAERGSSARSTSTSRPGSRTCRTSASSPGARA